MSGYPTLPTSATVALEKFRSAGRHDGAALPARLILDPARGPVAVVMIGGIACPYASEVLARDALQAMVRRGAVFTEGEPC